MNDVTEHPTQLPWQRLSHWKCQCRLLPHVVLALVVKDSGFQRPATSNKFKASLRNGDPGHQWSQRKRIGKDVISENGNFEGSSHLSQDHSALLRWVDGPQFGLSFVSIHYRFLIVALAIQELD